MFHTPRIALVAVLVAAAPIVGACGDDGQTPMQDTPPPESLGEFGDYVGLTVEEARDKAEQDGRPSRVVRVDGEDLPVTMDFIENRLNFEVEEGRVTVVTTG